MYSVCDPEEGHFSPQFSLAPDFINRFYGWEEIDGVRVQGLILGTRKSSSTSKPDKIVVLHFISSGLSDSQSTIISAGTALGAPAIAEHFLTGERSALFWPYFFCRL